MADIKKNYIDTERQFGGVPYGNLTALEFNMNTTSGVVDDSNVATAVQIDDVIEIGVLPAGFRIMDALIILSAVYTASSTFTIGFAYVDGVDDADVPQDADYFTADLAADAASRTPMDNLAVAPLELPKDAYLIVDNGVAAQATTGKMSVIVQGILRGDK